MWADFEQRGRTEVDTLNGYVARQAIVRGLETPLNTAIVDLVHRLESGCALAQKDVVALLYGHLAMPRDAH